MNKTTLGLVTLVTLALSGFSSVSLADGKATFDGTCGDCHEVGDFEGEDAAELSGIIKEIVAGEVSHKEKLTLTEQQITEVAAYMAGGGK
jgi:mono/diheme cytochrome c family protein